MWPNNNSSQYTIDLFENYCLVWRWNSPYFLVHRILGSQFKMICHGDFRRYEILKRIGNDFWMVSDDLLDRFSMLSILIRDFSSSSWSPSLFSVLLSSSFSTKTDYSKEYSIFFRLNQHYPIWTDIHNYHHYSVRPYDYIYGIMFDVVPWSNNAVVDSEYTSTRTRTCLEIDSPWTSFFRWSSKWLGPSFRVKWSAIHSLGSQCPM